MIAFFPSFPGVKNGRGLIGALADPLLPVQKEVPEEGKKNFMNTSVW